MSMNELIFCEVVCLLIMCNKMYQLKMIGLVQHPKSDKFACSNLKK